MATQQLFLRPQEIKSPYNTVYHEDELDDIRNVMQRRGFAKPIDVDEDHYVINADDYKLVAAAWGLGIGSIPVRVVAFRSETEDGSAFFDMEDEP